MDRIPIFPLDIVLFPGETVPLHIFEERYCLMTEEALAKGYPIGIVLAKQDQPDDRIEFEPERIGTAAKIVSVDRIPDGRFILHVVGWRRFAIERVVSHRMFQEADIVWLGEPPGDAGHANELAQKILHRVEDLGGEVVWDDEGTRDPVRVSHAVGAALPFDLGAKQQLLECPHAEARLEREAQWLRVPPR